MDAYGLNVKEYRQNLRPVYKYGETLKNGDKPYGPSKEKAVASYRDC